MTKKAKPTKSLPPATAGAYCYTPSDVADEVFDLTSKRVQRLCQEVYGINRKVTRRAKRTAR